MVKDLRVPSKVDWDLTNATNGGMSQSLLGNAQTCPRRFLFQMNRYYDPSKERNMAYGSMVHEILDKLYTGFYEETFGVTDFVEVIQKGIDKYKLPDVFKASEQELLKALAEAMLLEYVQWYKKDFKELRFDAVESKFCVPFHGYIMRGKKDGRFLDKNGGVWHIEHKNYSRINEDSMQLRLSFDLQNLYYMLADQLEFGRTLKGVLYNVLRKPDIRKEMTTGDVVGHIRKLVKSKPTHYFIRWEIPYNATDVKMFGEELKFKLDALNDNIQACRRCPAETLGRFWKNECACDQPYQCEFLQACSSGHLTGYKRKTSMFPELA